VFGTAQVSGGAWETSPLFIQGTRFSLTNCKPGFIQIGCECHSFSEWTRVGLAIARQNDFSQAQIKEYRAYIRLFKQTGK